MNDVLGWQIQNRVWLCLAGTVLISAIGCSSPVKEILQQPVNQGASDSESEIDELAPDSPQLRAMIDESRQFVERGELDKAIGKCTSVLSVLRRGKSEFNGSDFFKALHSEVLHLRGRAYLEKGFPQIAIADFDDAIRFGGDALNEKTHVLRARAEARLKHWSQAVEDCGRAIRLNPNNGEAYLVRGRALEAMRQFDRAETSFLEAQRLGMVVQKTFKPPIKSAPSFSAEAKSSMDAGIPSVACEILEKAILDGNDSWETRGLLALAQFQLREFSQAISTSTRAIEMNPQYADAYRIRGLSYLQMGRFDQTIADLNAAIALDESMAEQLKPGLSEARRHGGIDPILRTAVTARIRKSVAAETRVASSPGPSERWLLELIAKRKSSDQIDQFKTLLAATSETELDSLDWLADFLMLDYRVAVVKDLRNYLDRKSPDVSKLEKQLWESVKSPTAAAAAGVNAFSDLAAYSIEYGYLDLLQKSIELEVCRIKFAHVYQSIDKENTDCLKLILPHVELIGRETSKLLRYCIENDRKDHAMLIVDQYEGSLTWDVIQFLDMGEVML